MSDRRESVADNLHRHLGVPKRDARRKARLFDALGTGGMSDEPKGRLVRATPHRALVDCGDGVLASVNTRGATKGLTPEAVDAIAALVRAAQPKSTTTTALTAEETDR